MKNLSGWYPVVLGCSVLLTTISSPARAEFKCDGRQLSRVDATACAHAAQGSQSLRRFVTRTEKIYGLQMRDYIRFVGDEPKATSARAAQETSRASVARIASPSR